MEELLELRTLVQDKNYHAALLLIDEMEEMSREDKINKIESYLIILLLHLIKRHAEKRTTRSWDTSIANACDSIERTNRRRKTGGHYLSEQGLKESIHDVYTIALRNAASEAFEGRYEMQEIAQMIGRETIEREALALIWKEA